MQKRVHGGFKSAHAVVVRPDRSGLRAAVAAAVVADVDLTEHETGSGALGQPRSRADVPAALTIVGIES